MMLARCTLAGPLPAGASSTFELTFEVTAADGTEIVNVAEVTDDGCNCDTDDATTVIVDPSPLPFTGFVIAGLIPLALALIGAGTGLTLLARLDRRRPAEHS
jgi:hypothetical protein